LNRQFQFIDFQSDASPLPLFAFADFPSFKGALLLGEAMWHENWMFVEYPLVLFHQRVDFVEEVQKSYLYIGTQEDEVPESSSSSSSLIVYRLVSQFMGFISHFVRD
jgi:hypothetical protein